MSDNINATKAYDLEVLGRATVDGRRWVIYSDGQYRHVVAADHYADSGCDSRIEDDEARCDAYTAWCGRGGDAWSDDATAVRVASECGCEFVHSAADGCCGRLDVEHNDTSWRPTHMIQSAEATTLVMLTDDGVAYTREEWEDTVGADYEVVDGKWLFQGKAFTGTVTAM